MGLRAAAGLLYSGSGGGSGGRGVAQETWPGHMLLTSGLERQRGGSEGRAPWWGVMASLCFSGGKRGSEAWAWGEELQRAMTAFIAAGTRKEVRRWLKGDRSVAGCDWGRRTGRRLTGQGRAGGEWPGAA